MALLESRCSPRFCTRLPCLSRPQPNRKEEVFTSLRSLHCLSNGDARFGILRGGPNTQQTLTTPPDPTFRPLIPTFPTATAARDSFASAVSTHPQIINIQICIQEHTIWRPKACNLPCRQWQCCFPACPGRVRSRQLPLRWPCFRNQPTAPLLLQYNHPTSICQN